MVVETNRIRDQVDPVAQVPTQPVLAEERRGGQAVVASGSMIQVIGGIAAVVLAILGLSHVVPFYLAAIATIVVGAGLLFQGGSLAAGFEQFAEQSGEQEGMGGGMTVEFMGGVSGIVLGILALLDIVPTVLLGAAAIVFGATLILGSLATAQMRSMIPSPHLATARSVASGSLIAVAGGQTLVGVAAIVLGILTLVYFTSLVSWSLILVAMLIVGAAMLCSGAAITGKVLGAFRR
jgi:hypothetical protein